MGRAGWGLLTMTLISLAVAVAGLWDGNTMGATLDSNPTLDKLYTTDNFTNLENTEAFDSALYGYIDGEDDITSTSEDYYTSSWSFTRGVLQFFKNFFVPISVLGSIPAFKVFPANVVLWVIGIIWNLIYALLLFEIIWRFNIFD